MSSISRATQTEVSDLLAAVKLRLDNVKSILPDAAWPESREVQRSPTTTAKSKSTQIKRDRPTVAIGRYQTRIARDVFQRISWDSYSLATRALLTAVFDKETLATRNISGIKVDSKGRRWSELYMLDPHKISDIVQIVKQNCKVDERCIRKIMTIKCADSANTKRNRNL